jgi:hypothetical protein
VVLPYPFALAALPVATESTAYGAVFVTWPGSHPPELSDWERDRRAAPGNGPGPPGHEHAGHPARMKPPHTPLAPDHAAPIEARGGVRALGMRPRAP